MTVENIQRALYSFCSSNAWLMTPNCYALGHEADVLVLRKSGLAAEYEIKMSRSDFRADFQKKDKHQALQQRLRTCPNYFFYVAPAGIIPREEVPSYAGLIELTESEDPRYPAPLIGLVKEAPKLHSVKHYQPGAGRLVMDMAESLYHRHFRRLPIAGFTGKTSNTDNAGPASSTDTTGITGPTGSTGTTGIPGRTSNTGPTGSTGTTGKASKAGNTGRARKTRKTGLTWKKGITSNTGPASNTRQAGKTS